MFDPHDKRLPRSYVDWISSNDGFEGDLSDHGVGYVVIWSPSSIPDRYDGYDMKTYLDPNFYPFGSDGGGEMLVFDLRRNDDAVFMLPYIGMSDELPVELCNSFNVIVKAITRRRSGAERT